MTGMVPPPASPAEVVDAARRTIEWHGDDDQAPGCDGCRTAPAAGCQQLAWARETLAPVVAAG